MLLFPNLYANNQTPRLSSVAKHIKVVPDNVNNLGHRQYTFSVHKTPMKTYMATELVIKSCGWSLT